MDVHGARIKDDAALASHLHGFSRDHDNGAGSIMEQYHFTPNGSRPSTRSVETSKKSAMRDTSRNVKFERPWNLSLMARSDTPSTSARSRCFRWWALNSLRILLIKSAFFVEATEYL